MRKTKTESRNVRRKRLYEAKPAPGESNYGRKRKWLDKNGGHGSDVPFPKPWKKVH